jgi:putative membrane protein
MIGGGGILIGLLVLLFLLLLLGAGAVVVVLIARQGSGGTGQGTGWQPRPEGGALEILRQRYARGEITREEFLSMRDDLEGRDVT